MDTILPELEQSGFVVLPDVLNTDDCALFRAEYEKWAAGGAAALHKQTTVQRRGTAQLAVTWAVRLAARRVFGVVWDTEKLTSSMEQVYAVPPHTDTRWRGWRQQADASLACDQAAEQVGVHGVRALLLPQAVHRDGWTVKLVRGSHALHAEFCAAFPGYQPPTAASPRGLSTERRRYEALQMAWLVTRGCTVQRLEAPAGTMILWDCRTFWGLCAPLTAGNAKKNEPTAAELDKWFFAIPVSMAPAVWLDDNEAKTKIDAFERRMATGFQATGAHVHVIEEVKTGRSKGQLLTEEEDSDEAEVLESKEVLELVGVVKYDLDDGLPNGPDWKPQWINNDVTSESTDDRLI